MSRRLEPSRRNVVEVAPIKGGFSVTFVGLDGNRRHLDALPTLRRAEAWATVQAFRLDTDRVRVLCGKVG